MVKDESEDLFDFDEEEEQVEPTPEPAPEPVNAEELEQLREFKAVAMAAQREGDIGDAFEKAGYTRKLAALYIALQARVHAERELRAEDEAVLAGLESWRRGKATEALRDSFDDRLDKRVEPTKQRLISEAEAKIGTRLIYGPSGPDGNVAIARPLTELLAEAEQESQVAEDAG